MRKLLLECLYALNTLPNKRYIYQEQKTTTYKLAEKLNEFLNLKLKGSKHIQLCASCEHFEKFNDYENRCTRYPPVITRMQTSEGDTLKPLYPLVPPGNSCGEWMYLKKFKIFEEGEAW